VPLTRRPPAPAASAVAALALAALVGCPSAEPGADDVGPRDAGPSADAGTAPDAGAPPACERPSGPGATHDTDVAADEVWRAADGPHTVPRNIRVLATLRVEPCAQVLLGPNVRLTVGDDTSPAALEAQGTATQPITFGAVDAARPWTGLIVSQSGRLDLGHVTISDAASPADDQNGGGAILAYGDRRAEGAINRSVKVTNVRVERARGHAVAFVGAAGFAEGSSGLTLADGGRPERPQALRLPIAAAPTIPTNLSIGGYPSGAVALVAGNGGLPGDVEIPARGAPYHVEAVIRVAPTADGPPVTLTIGAGVVMRFDPTNGTSGIAVGSTERRQGILRAIGTEAAPIQLTSAKDLAQHHLQRHAAHREPARARDLELRRRAERRARVWVWPRGQRRRHRVAGRPARRAVPGAIGAALDGRRHRRGPGLALGSRRPRRGLDQHLRRRPGLPGESVAGRGRRLPRLGGRRAGVPLRGA
jgi:hypothetical protein